MPRVRQKDKTRQDKTRSIDKTGSLTRNIYYPIPSYHIPSYPISFYLFIHIRSITSTRNYPPARLPASRHFGNTVVLVVLIVPIGSKRNVIAYLLACYKVGKVYIANNNSKVEQDLGKRYLASFDTR